MVFKTVAKIFWEYLKLNPIYIVYNIFFMIITVINNFYLPKIYGAFYDTFQKNDFDISSNKGLLASFFLFFA